jgi:hypothetical protein
MQGAINMPVAGPLPFPTVTGVWEGGGGAGRRRGGNQQRVRVRITILLRYKS